MPRLPGEIKSERWATLSRSAHSESTGDVSSVHPGDFVGIRKYTLTLLKCSSKKVHPVAGSWISRKRPSMSLRIWAKECLGRALPSEQARSHRLRLEGCCCPKDAVRKVSRSIYEGAREMACEIARSSEWPGFTPASEEDRDAVRAPEAHSQARPFTVTRPKRRTRRVHSQPPHRTFVRWPS